MKSELKHCDAQTGELAARLYAVEKGSGLLDFRQAGTLLEQSLDHWRRYRAGLETTIDGGEGS